MTLLAVLFWALAAPAGAAEGPSFGAGTSVAAGTAKYWRVALSGDAQWTAPPWVPFAWTELGWDRYANRFSFGGGTWRELGEDVRVKGGLSYSVGRFRDTDTGSHAVTLETGAERAFEGVTAGAEYLYTTGALGGARTGRTTTRNRGGQVRGSQAAGTGPSFTDHYLAAYGRIPSGDTTVGLRAAVDLPSDADTVLSETLSWKVPVEASTWLTPALTLEHDGDTAAILSLALYHLF